MDRRRLSEEIKAGIIYLNIGLISIILIISTIYLLKIGETSSYGYQFTMKATEHNDLKTKNENLKLQLLQSSSLSDLRSNNMRIMLMEQAEPQFYESREKRLSLK